MGGYTGYLARMNDGSVVADMMMTGVFFTSSCAELKDSVAWRNTPEKKVDHFNPNYQ